MRKLSLSNDAQKFVDKLAPKQFKQVVSKVMDLTQDAVPADSEKLKGFDGRRTDMGEFRIVYHFDADTVYKVLPAKKSA